MKKIWKEHKKDIIKGTITIVFLPLAYLFFANLINGKEIASNDDSIQALVQSNNVDTGKQQNIQLQQENKNKGDVTNEFVAGDKKTTNVYNSPIKETSKKKADTKIVNNGNLAVDNKGTVYQNTYINPKPEPRKVIQSDIDEILQKVPKDYIIAIDFSMSDEECNNYGLRLAEVIQRLGYNTELSEYGQIQPMYFDKRFYLSVNDNNKKAGIIVYPLKD